MLASSAVPVIAPQPHIKGSAKTSLILFSPPLGSEKINVYAKTCEDSHGMCWEAGKGQTLNLTCPISPKRH